ncbi:MAG TPA: hypothetical protein VHT70_01775 [Candidatus Saccharimonadales bacterium]|jgi:hypothetical protein|nr:hypothetical protein [Candidatus Saccharimonadales bacterium]
MMEGNRDIPQQQDFGGADLANVIPSLPDLVEGVGEITETAYDEHRAREEGDDKPEMVTWSCHLGSDIPSEREIRWRNAWRSQLGLPLLDYQEEVDKARKTWQGPEAEA